MISKFQREPFPVDKVAKFQSIIVRTNNGSIVEVPYQKLKLQVIGTQLCFYYESEDGDLVMPIARSTTIENLFE